MKKILWTSLIKKMIEFLKSKKIIAIPLGTLFLLAAVLGGLLIKSLFLAIIASILGTAFGLLVFWSNKKLFSFVSDRSKSRDQHPLKYMIVYLLILILICVVFLYLIEQFNFYVAFVTGATTIVQLLALSVIDTMRPANKPVNKQV